MPGQVVVTRIRVSHIAGQIRGDLPDQIGLPNEFETLLASRDREVCGLPVTLPFDLSLAVDTAFWVRNTGNSLSKPEASAGLLRSAAVPLRYCGQVETATYAPRLEAHLHPFGIVAFITVDVCWPEPVTIEVASQRVLELEGQPATVTVGPKQSETCYGTAATAAINSLADLLTNAPDGNAYDTPSHRLTTVISGMANGQLDVIPPAGGQLNVALHSLSAGFGLMPQPQNAFVRQWTNADYRWPPSSLVYMLDIGSAALSSAVERAVSRGLESASAHHRRLLLTLAYITALAGLVHVDVGVPDARSDFFTDWANRAAARLGWLYGPAWVYRDWGLVPREFLLRTGVTADINVVRQRTGKLDLYPSGFDEELSPWP
jgi:hypothetical protein